MLPFLVLAAGGPDLEKHTEEFYEVALQKI